MSEGTYYFVVGCYIVFISGVMGWLIITSIIRFVQRILRG